MYMHKPQLHGKNYFSKVYRTVHELGIQGFAEQSFEKFTVLFTIKCRTFNDFS